MTSANVARVPHRLKPANDPAPADTAVAEIAYQTVDWAPPVGQLGQGIYEPFALQALHIEGAQEHPTPLVQSAAMASVAPPKPPIAPICQQVL